MCACARTHTDVHDHMQELPHANMNSHTHKSIYIYTHTNAIANYILRAYTKSGQMLALINLLIEVLITHILLQGEIARSTRRYPFHDF